MSQTTGQSGNDPEKDEWLKQFSGLPEDFDPEELKNDRPYVDAVMQKRADGLTIEGQIEAMGDFAHGVREHYGPTNDRRSLGRIIAYAALTAFLLWLATTYVIF